MCLCRYMFLSGVIFLLPEKFPLMFLAVQFCYYEFSQFCCIFVPLSVMYLFFLNVFSISSLVFSCLNMMCLDVYFWYLPCLEFSGHVGSNYT